MSSGGVAGGGGRAGGGKVGAGVLRCVVWSGVVVGRRREGRGKMETGRQSGQIVTLRGLLASRKGVWIEDRKLRARDGRGPCHF